MLTKDGTIHTDKLVTYGDAPGYRDISLCIEINEGDTKREVTLYFSKDNAIAIMRHVHEVNRIAWAGGKPIDAIEGEKIPRWL